jgi:hypothetical protein
MSAHFHHPFEFFHRIQAVVPEMRLRMRSASGPRVPVGDQNKSMRNGALQNLGQPLADGEAIQQTPLGDQCADILILSLPGSIEIRKE